MSNTIPPIPPGHLAFIEAKDTTATPVANKEKYIYYVSWLAPIPEVPSSWIEHRLSLEHALQFELHLQGDPVVSQLDTDVLLSFLHRVKGHVVRESSADRYSSPKQLFALLNHPII